MNTSGKTTHLGDAAIAEHLSRLPGWQREADAIRRDFVFRDFSEAFAFMARVAMLSERQDHHPDWSNSWNRVCIRLSSHDAGGLTEKDFRLAAAIDLLVATPSP